MFASKNTCIFWCRMRFWLSMLFLLSTHTVFVLDFDWGVACWCQVLNKNDILQILIHLAWVMWLEPKPYWILILLLDVYFWTYSCCCFLEWFSVIVYFWIEMLLFDVDQNPYWMSCLTIFRCQWSPIGLVYFLLFGLRFWLPM